MAKSRYRFFYDVFNEDENHSQKGLMEQDIKALFSDATDIIYSIPIEEEYRPDLIAKRFYGNPKLFWVIVYANSISDSPEGFYATRTIRVPRYEKVNELI